MQLIENAFTLNFTQLDCQKFNNDEFCNNQFSYLE